MEDEPCCEFSGEQGIEQEAGPPVQASPRPEGGNDKFLERQLIYPLYLVIWMEGQDADGQPAHAIDRNGPGQERGH